MAFSCGLPDVHDLRSGRWHLGRIIGNYYGRGALGKLQINFKNRYFNFLRFYAIQRVVFNIIFLFLSWPILPACSFHCSHSIWLADLHLNEWVLVGTEQVTPSIDEISWSKKISEVVGAFISVFLIWVVTGVLVYLAIDRIISKNYEIQSTIMAITAGIGVCVNLM